MPLTNTSTKKERSSSVTKKQGLLPSISDEDLQNSEPVLFILIGKPGSGKSTFVAQIPNSIFLYHKSDHGIIELKRRGLVPKSTFIWEKPFNTLKGFTEQLEHVKENAIAAGKNTVIIEGLTGISRIWTDHAISIVFDNNAAKFNDYGKGVNVLKTRNTYLPALMKHIHDLRAAGLNVIITGHTTEKSDNDSKSGTALKRLRTEFPSTLLNEISAYASLHGVLSKIIVPEKVSGKDIVKIGREGVNTYLSVSEDAYTSEAKNRYGLVEPIEINETPQENFTTFCNALKIDPQTLKDL